MKLDKKKSKEQQDFWDYCYRSALDGSKVEVSSINYVSAANSLNTYARDVASQDLQDRKNAYAKIERSLMRVDLEEFDG